MSVDYDQVADANRGYQSGRVAGADQSTGCINTDVLTAHHHIPVIIQTGVMLTAKDLETALAAGAYDYIRKPIEPIELAARVNSALTFASMHLREIEKKNLELVEKTLVLVKNNEFNIKMAKELEQLTEILKANPDANSHIHKILNDVDQKIKEDSWQHFAISFQNVHPEFNKNILSKFPALTSGELKLCILIKLGINIKDTASLLCLSPESIKVERSRLRKKLAIDNDVNLQNFIEAI